MTDEENKEQKSEEKQEEIKEEKKETPPASIPYDRFKEVNDKANELEAQLKKISDKTKADEEKKLAEEKKWQELAELKDKELKAKDSELIRLRVAAEKNLPVELIDRLKGETKEEIEADADKLLEFIKPDESKGVPPGKKGGKNTQLDIRTMTPEEIRKNTAAILQQGNQ